MRTRFLGLLLFVVTGCFSPSSYPERLFCDSDRSCPPGQTCHAIGMCLTPDSNRQCSGEECEDACQIRSQSELVPGYPYDIQLFTSDVLPVLKATCATAECHAPPRGVNGFTVWPDAVLGSCDFAATFNNVAKHIDLANPQNSRLLVAVNGAYTTHAIQYQQGAPELSALAGYALDAATRYATSSGAVVTPPPGASPADFGTFQDAIQPILDNTMCSAQACHGSGAGTFTLATRPERDSQGMLDNFLAVTARMNLADPLGSLVLLKATNVHSSSSAISRAETQSFLAWIEAAQANSKAINCVSAANFNLGVFEDEIWPMLKGDIDYNRPGQSSAFGCTLGVCHGQDRGPGKLLLLENADPLVNLQNFACFIKPEKPSASDILLCPLNHPDCSYGPHEGGDIFFGGDDRNFQKLLSFIYSGTPDVRPLDFAYYVRRINPLFNAQNCADTSQCHGITSPGQPIPNGSNFGILAGVYDLTSLTYNFTSSAAFANFLDREGSSLFLYPTNEIDNTAERVLATGIPHPGGENFAPDSPEAAAILEWSGGLRLDADGFNRNWLVAGVYYRSDISDPISFVDEEGGNYKIFDDMGNEAFNAGEWDGYFADQSFVDLSDAFGLSAPNPSPQAQIAFALAYVLNITPNTIPVALKLNTTNTVRVYVGSEVKVLTGTGEQTILADLPGKQLTRILIKVMRPDEQPEFGFSVRFRRYTGSGEGEALDPDHLVFLLGPDGGI